MSQQGQQAYYNPVHDISTKAVNKVILLASVLPFVNFGLFFFFFSPIIASFSICTIELAEKH